MVLILHKASCLQLASWFFSTADGFGTSRFCLCLGALPVPSLGLPSSARLHLQPSQTLPSCPLSHEAAGAARWRRTCGTPCLPRARANGHQRAGDGSSVPGTARPAHRREKTVKNCERLALSNNSNAPLLNSRQQTWPFLTELPREVNQNRLEAQE